MKRLLQVLLAAPLLLVLAACHTPTDPNATAPAFELRLYQVPVAQSDAIAQQLTKVLVNSSYLVGTQSHTEMNVSQPYPGAVLVLAPSALQPSIARAIDALKEAARDAPAESASSANAEAPPLQVRLWVIQARAGEGADAAALAELEPTLKELRQSLGTSHFVVDDFVSTVAYGQDVGVALSRMRTVELKHWPTTRGSVLEIEYSDPKGQNLAGLHTAVPVRPGEYLVLAQAASDPERDASTGDDAVLMNLLVIRADPLPTSS